MSGTEETKGPKRLTNSIATMYHSIDNGYKILDWLGAEPNNNDQLCKEKMDGRSLYEVSLSNSKGQSR